MKSRIMYLMLAAGIMAGVSSSSDLHGWAEEKAAEKKPQQEAPAAKQPAEPAAAESGPSLGDLHSFEILSFEPQEFSSTREAVPPEIGEYARTAIQNDDRLRYSSPGEGVLHFYCNSPSCGRIRAEVTVGADGPVVWKTVQTFQPFFTVMDPNPRRFAKMVVTQLGEDYNKAMKALPVKIQIKDGE